MTLFPLWIYKLTHTDRFAIMIERALAAVLVSAVAMTNGTMPRKSWGTLDGGGEYVTAAAGW